MSDYINLTLDSGMTVKVFAVPPYVTNAVLSKFKDPPTPTRPVNPEVAFDKDDTIPDPQNPDYLAAKRKVDEQRGEALLNVRLLYGLRDEIPPDNWPTPADLEMWEYIGIAPDISSSGSHGRRLAWLKFGVLSSGQDMERVIAAIDSFMYLDKGEVDGLIESFRNQRRNDSTK